MIINNKNIIIILCLIVFGISGSVWPMGNMPVAEQGASEENTQAYNFRIEALNGNAFYNLSDFKGKPVFRDY